MGMEVLDCKGSSPVVLNVGWLTQVSYAVPRMFPVWEGLVDGRSCGWLMILTTRLIGGETRVELA